MSLPSGIVPQVLSTLTHLSIAVAVLSLSACGGGSSGGDTVGNTSTDNLVTTYSSYPRYAYVANYGGSNVSIYTVDSQSGQLHHKGHAKTTGSTDAVVVEPSGEYAYAANFDSGTVSVFRINAENGALTSTGDSVSAGGGAVGITTDPTGKFLYVTTFANSMAAFSIDALTGNLTLINTIPATGGSIAQHVAMHPSGKFAYVANLYTDDVLIFSLDAVTGAVANTDTVTVGRSPSWVAFDPTGKYAYVTNHDASSISVFTVNSTTGALAPVATENIGVMPQAMVVDATGQYAYVATLSGVKPYRIDTSTGRLTLLSDYWIPSGGDPRTINIDPTSRFLYVTNGDNSTITTLQIDQNTHIPRPINSTSWLVTSKGSALGFALVNGPTPLVSSSKFAYAANAYSDDISAFTIDSGTGALSSISSSIATGAGPNYLAADPYGRFAYVTNSGSANISAYGIDSLSGALSQLGTVATGNIPSGIAIDANSRFAYVANAGDDSVSSYSISATGVMSAVNTISTADYPAVANPGSILVDPTGTHVIVAGTGTSAIRSYALNLATGALDGTFYRSGTAGTSPSSIAVDPSGRFIYVTNAGSDNVMVWSLDTTYGFLSKVTNGTIVTGVGPSSIVIDPLGQFAYVANATEGSISAYFINYETGLLVQIDADPVISGIQNFPAGTSPGMLAMDMTGKYLYVTESGTVSTYTIDRSNGTLNMNGSVSAGNGPESIITTGH